VTFVGVQVGARQKFRKTFLMFMDK